MTKTNVRIEERRDDYAERRWHTVTCDCGEQSVHLTRISARAWVRKHVREKHNPALKLVSEKTEWIE